MAWSYAEWYERNRERLSKRRKKKYALDPDYRKRAIAQSKSYYKNNHIPKKRDEIVVNGETLYSISKLAQVTGRSPLTLRAYHNRGIIPMPYTDKRGWRYYSVGQIRVVNAAIAKLLAGRFRNMQEMREYIKERW